MGSQSSAQSSASISRRTCWPRSATSTASTRIPARSRSVLASPSRSKSTMLQPLRKSADLPPPRAANGGEVVAHFAEWPRADRPRDRQRGFRLHSIGEALDGLVRSRSTPSCCGRRAGLLHGNSSAGLQAALAEFPPFTAITIADPRETHQLVARVSPFLMNVGRSAAVPNCSSRIPVSRLGGDYLRRPS